MAQGAGFWYYILLMIWSNAETSVRSRMKVLTTEKLSYNPYIINKYRAIRMTYCDKPPVLRENSSRGFNRWQWCWWHPYVGDFMMVTDFRYWWQNYFVDYFFRYVGDFLNVLNRSRISWIGHQHLKIVTIIICVQHLSLTSM